MNLHPYRGITASFATKHEKQIFVAPYFAALEISLMVPDIDTDVLGTFSGEVAREGTPKEVALKKARMGMEAAGLPHGIASEGSIGPDPIIPFMNSDIEWMAWVDTERGIEIVEFHRSLDIVAAQAVLEGSEDIEAFLKRADFPNHGLIVRAEKGDEIFKGIRDRKALEAAMNALSTSKKIIVESDLRSHQSPSRQKNIAAVTEKLVSRLSTLCHQCQSPGWGEVGNLYGLECSECRNFMDRAVRGKVLGCTTCDYREELLSERKFVEPAECEICNP